MSVPGTGVARIPNRLVSPRVVILVKGLLYKGPRDCVFLTMYFIKESHLKKTFKSNTMKE